MMLTTARRQFYTIIKMVNKEVDCTLKTFPCKQKCCMESLGYLLGKHVNVAENH